MGNLELIPNAETIIDPDSGEVLALAEAPPQIIAAVLGRIKLAISDQLDALRDVERLLGEEMIRRMDRSGEWTQHARGVKVSAPSPSAGTVSWDAEILDGVLDDLVAAGLIDRDAKLRAVSQRTELVTHAAGIKALEKIPAVAERIGVAKRTTEQGPRKVRVEVNPGEM